MPKASHKTKGGNKNAADKHTFNQNPPGGGENRDSQTPGTDEQDPKRRLGQFGGAGEAPLIKK